MRRRTAGFSILFKMIFAIVGGFLMISLARAATYEVESDPVAYILKGFSVHGTLVLPTSRFDFGAFGLEVPKFVGNNGAFTHNLIGASVNWDYFGSRFTGLFGGVGIAVTRNQIVHDVGEEEVNQTQFYIGPRIGFRIGGENGFFISPWVGVYYVFGRKDVVVGKDRFHVSPIQIFPTIHVGFRF